MSIEYEAKIFNIKPPEFREKIKHLGAKKAGSYNFRRHVFDTIPAQENKWVRLRTNGRETTITCKEIVSDGIDGVTEKEIVVDDFEKALELLEAIGLKSRGYQENTREEYALDDTQITIDHWPRLEPYAEIEGKNTADVFEVIEKLGFSKHDAVYQNTEELYKTIGIDIKKVKDLRF